MPRKKSTKKNKKIEVGAYAHEGQKRINNPPVGLVSSETDKLDSKQPYQHDPHIDPYLSWAGKAEGMSFDVQNVSLHVHERIDSQRIVKSFTKKEAGKRQPSLFEQPENELPLNKAVEFYQHEQDWTNRLIAGDSLMVMNSLLRKEGMAGKLQMVYIDPPYGITYNSNFQPFVNKTVVRDKDEDIPAEPEMIQAFRDTWELGIHSYLTHLRDRLLLVRELLHESGSCFVQISDENVHHVREIMDEVFGKDNFVSEIVIKKTGGLSQTALPRVQDYLCWYAKNKPLLKFRGLYIPKTFDDSVGSQYRWIEFLDGKRRVLKKDDDISVLLKSGARLLKPDNLTSQGNPIKEFKFENDIFRGGWKTTLEGMGQLAKQGRIIKVGAGIWYVRYLEDFPVYPLTNLWTDTSSSFQAKIYVVQTNTTTLQRCILLTTDPGDLVFDPTCGSGTTAFVAEQWGRRWITCDTSRVAITLAKQRLMTAKFDYYKLAHHDEGVASGFEYKKVPHITLGSIANNEPPAEEVLYDQPSVNRSKVRVTGPFTVEAVPSLRTKPFDGTKQKILGIGDQLARTGETANQALWRDELKAAGIRATGGKKVEFARVEPMAGTRFLHAEADVIEKNVTKRAVISFGPDYGPLEQRQVEEAIKEARELKPKPDLVIFAAFHFDPEAAKDIDQIELPGITVLKAQMSVDLLTSDLRKKRSSNQSYWLIGQPDVVVNKKKDGTYQVTVNGFDYYNPVTGEIESGDTSKIAMWFLDTDYDEQSLLPEQVFFPMKDAKRDWTRLAKALNGEIEEEKLEAFEGVVSLPFKAGDNKKVAVKIIDDRGIESFVVKSL